MSYGGVLSIIIAIFVITVIAFIAPSLGTHCLNETYCCNDCVNNDGVSCMQYCDCPCDGKFDPFVDDPLYWFIERNL
jgi:hypothetical protein